MLHPVESKADDAVNMEIANAVILLFFMKYPPYILKNVIVFLLTTLYHP